MLFAPVLLADNKDDESNVTALTTAQKGEIWEQAIHILGGNANVISRWTDAVRFTLLEDSEHRHTTHASEVIREIADHTALPMSILQPQYDSVASYISTLAQLSPYQLQTCEQQSECANFLVIITTIENMQKIAQAIPLRDVYQKALLSDQSAVCFFAPFQGASVIRQAVVFVRSDLSQDMIETCLQEEIYQSFGLFNDYTDSVYFSFNNRVEPKEITHYDRALLEAVYEFPPGAPAFLIAKRLISNLENSR